MNVDRLPFQGTVKSQPNLRVMTHGSRHTVQFCTYAILARQLNLNSLLRTSNPLAFEHAVRESEVRYHRRRKERDNIVLDTGILWLVDSGTQPRR
jgi:hypothetical protein